MEELRAQGRLLGFFADLDGHEERARLGPGDALIAFTDGVTERHDEHTWFGPDELRVLVQSCANCSADDLATLIEQRVIDGFAEPPADDIAVLVVRRVG